MPPESFHHGNLREVLLTTAQQTLQTDGRDALSLRELARQAGVSHGAPRRHFRDRRSLLHALAERGFDELSKLLDDAADPDQVYEQRFRATARAFVDFAIANSALLDLMFTITDSNAPPSLQAATARFFKTSTRVVTDGHHAGLLSLRDPDRAQMLLIATLHGIATLIAAGRLQPDRADPLIEDATQLFLQRPAQGNLSSRPTADTTTRPQGDALGTAEGSVVT